MELESPITQDVIDRWTSHIRPMPLPDFHTPVGGAPLCNISDEVLMIAPPQLIAHVQRTAAQGGLQIISPRQTPITAMMLRVKGDHRQIGDHVVGSTAHPDVEWPTLDDTDFSHLLPDEPLSSVTANAAIRGKTRALPITKASTELSDPILGCLVKGRAVIDVLKRPDVAGNAEAMTSVLAAAWGVGTEDIDDMDAFTIGIDGPLLRHAIKTDEVYPMCYAPMHVRRCISVGASEVSRHLLPDDSAMDWRRMRVHCEAVFALCCSIEGYPLREIMCIPPPGDPSALGNRPGVLMFQPAPASAWTFESSTFSIFPDSVVTPARAVGIPREVLEAMTRYNEVVRPVSYAMSQGFKPSARRTMATKVEIPLGETISEGYRFMVKGLMVGAARGRTAAATVRNLIYNALESADDMTRLRLTRYISMAKEECMTHLGLMEVPDRMIFKLADKFLQVGEIIRLQVISEAARRGHTAEEWWSDIIAQAPERYSAFTEGTRGWATIGMWMVFKAPTERWHKLRSALNYAAIREAEQRSIGGIALPAKKGSEERLLAASRAVVKKMAKAYAGYYLGVADVGLALADVANEMGRPRSADVYKEAAYLWNLRARCLRGTNVNPLAKTSPMVSENHHRIFAMPIDLTIAPTPYRAFEAYKSHAGTSEILHTSVKRHLKDFQGSRISDAFKTMGTQMCPVAKSRLTSYLVNPMELGLDMEKAWEMLKQDVYRVSSVYGSVERSRSPSPTAKKVKVSPNVDFQIIMPEKPVGGISYWDLTADMEFDEVEWMEDVMDRGGPALEATVVEALYADVDALRAKLHAINSDITKGKKVVRETVK